VVTREELQQRIWPSDTFVDLDHGLYNAIKKLREAMGDSADTPRYIETLSRRGYRFIAPLIGPAPEPGGSARAADAPRDSIAVLPFLNLSADVENEFFVDGITEEIINALAQIEQLHVVARGSAFSFKGKHIDLRIIGEQLNVRTILEGSVRRAGNRLRITAQLVNAADGYHLWSERYDREMEDIFEVQDAIARSIAERLKVTLAGDQQARLVKAGTENLEAYKLYLKGRVLLYRRAAGLAIPRALECFKQAVALDSEYAPAWAGLADAYTMLDFYGFSRPEGRAPRGKQPAKRAVELDPGLGEAHSALACVYLMSDSDLAEAEKEFLCALELNPRYIQARAWYALFYLQLARGRLEEGISQAKLAMESDPLSGYAHAMLGMTYSVAGRYAEALQTLQRGVELEPESFLPRWSMHWTSHLSGRFAEAVAAGEEVLASSGRHPWAMATLAVILADWGKPAAAEALYVELMARAGRGYVQPSQLAIVAAAAGRQDEALRYARESVEIRDASVIWFSKYLPYTARLRADPRFQEILLKFGTG